MQVFKPLYYWDAGRHDVMREPSKFLTQDGLIGRAFMLHPFKLSSADAAEAFWQVRPQVPCFITLCRLIRAVNQIS